MLFSWLIPQEKKFFDMLEQYSLLVRECSSRLLELFSDFDQREEKRKRIKELEVQGDELQHKIVDELNSTFVTPIERDDIHKLASKLDDVLDFIDGAAERVILFKIQNPPDRLREMADVLHQASKELSAAMPLLRNMRKWERLKKHYVEINRLENRGDELMRIALVELFDTSDPIEIIKLKEIYEYVEEAIDMNEDVAVILENLVVKH